MLVFVTNQENCFRSSFEKQLLKQTFQDLLSVVEDGRVFRLLILVQLSSFPDSEFLQNFNSCFELIRQYISEFKLDEFEFDIKTMILPNDKLNVNYSELRVQIHSFKDLIEAITEIPIENVIYIYRVVYDHINLICPITFDVKGKVTFIYVTKSRGFELPTGLFKRFYKTKTLRAGDILYD